jgi:hypothetical protein
MHRGSGSGSGGGGGQPSDSGAYDTGHLSEHQAVGGVGGGSGSGALPGVMMLEQQHAYARYVKSEPRGRLMQ